MLPVALRLDYVRNEDASGQALMKSVGSTFGVASRGNKVMQWMLAKEQANEEPTFQDAATFDLSRTLPTAGGVPATRSLSDPDVRRHLGTQGVDIAQLDDAAQATNATLIFAMKTDFGDSAEAEKQLRAERDAAEAASTSAAASGSTPGPSTLGLAEVGESAAGADDGSATAASAAAARLREREASCEFTPEGVFAYALSLRQERSSGTQVGTVTAKEVAAFFSTEGAPKRASNSIIRTALTCLEKVPPPAAVFQEQKEALNRALAELDAIRVSKSSCRQGECLGEMEPSLAAGDGASDLVAEDMEMAAPASELAIVPAPAGQRSAEEERLAAENAELREKVGRQEKISQALRALTAAIDGP